MNAWRFNVRTPAQHRPVIACTLWTLYFDGPFESPSGTAMDMLRKALKKRGGQYCGERPRIYDVVKRLEITYPGAIERTKEASKCYRIATSLRPAELPPNPYELTARLTAPAKGDAPAVALERLDPHAALEAIGAICDEVLGHGLSPAAFATAERLADAIAENERIRADHDQTQAALLRALRENQTLRHALARRERS